jgi:hypothetical protein
MGMSGDKFSKCPGGLVNGDVASNEIGNLMGVNV